MESHRPASATDEPAQLEHLRWLYKELLRVEHHWTEQVQNQQQRISSLLAVTGILLAFLAGAGFLIRIGPPVRLWWARLFVGSLVLLCFALLMGILALKPKIPIAGTSPKLFGAARCFFPRWCFAPAPPPLWLDAGRIHERGLEIRNQESLLKDLCAAAAKDQEEANLPDAMLGRRLYMYRQIVFLVVSLVLLIISLLGFIFAHRLADGHDQEGLLETAVQPARISRR